MEEEIKLLNSLMTPAIQTALEEYTKAASLNAWMFILFGVIVLILGIAVFVICVKKRHKVDVEGGFIISTFAFVIGLVLVLANVSAVVQPKAAAIKALICDVRAK